MAKVDSRRQNRAELAAILAESRRRLTALTKEVERTKKLLELQSLKINTLDTKITAPRKSPSVPPATDPPVQPS